VCLIPEAELKHEEALHVEYNMRMNALIKYLDEDYQKFSDVGEAGRIEAELELQQHNKLVQDNDGENARIAERRQQRLMLEAQQSQHRIQQELLEAAQKEEERLAAAERFIKQEAAILEQRILPDKLEEAIIEALDNPVDPEFALDTHGNVFRGRTTKSLKVPPENLVNILAQNEDEDIALDIKN